MGRVSVFCHSQKDRGFQDLRAEIAGRVDRLQLFALPQRWPYCWWVIVVIDHHSRRLMGFAVFGQQPSSRTVRTFLGRLMQRVKAEPRYLITDQGKQFIADAFDAWSRRHGIDQRFGAIGKYGSIAVIERLKRTLKQECTRRCSCRFPGDAFGPS